MEAIVGPTKRFHHTHDVDASDTRVVGTPIAEREQGKLPIAFCADAVLLAGSRVGSLTRAARFRGLFLGLLPLTLRGFPNFLNVGKVAHTTRCEF